MKAAANLPTTNCNHCYSKNNVWPTKRAFALLIYLGKHMARAAERTTIQPCRRALAHAQPASLDLRPKTLLGTQMSVISQAVVKEGLTVWYVPREHRGVGKRVCCCPANPWTVTDRLKRARHLLQLRARSVMRKVRVSQEWVPYL